MVCTIGAVLAVIAGLALGSWRAGVAVALGLLAGAINGFMARRTMTAEVSFRALSMGRLAILSAVGLGLGALLGLQFVPLVLLGIAAAQIVLAFAAAVSMVRA